MPFGSLGRCRHCKREVRFAVTERGGVRKKFDPDTDPAGEYALDFPVELGDVKARWIPAEFRPEIHQRHGLYAEHVCPNERVPEIRGAA